ncbi:unnamed protein product [marine sediment metagenome]|uniref:Uncharacterized protein n=1 Tax=marine sediment metagenome TaxID=412755 RepID=X1GU28_9ZZZZ
MTRALRLRKGNGKRSNDYVVIELKVSKVDDKVCGQVLLLGWHHFEKDNGSSGRIDLVFGY